MAGDPSEREILWRDYALSADFYKFYVEIAVKLNVYYYAITGGIASFCFAQRQVAYAKWAFPAALLNERMPSDSFCLVGTVRCHTARRQLHPCGKTRYRGTPRVRPTGFHAVDLYCAAERECDWDCCPAVHFVEAELPACILAANYAAR